jgi:hypothetical protein
MSNDPGGRNRRPRLATPIASVPFTMTRIRIWIGTYPKSVRNPARFTGCGRIGHSRSATKKASARDAKTASITRATD